MLTSKKILYLLHERDTETWPDGLDLMYCSKSENFRYRYRCFCQISAGANVSVI
jgi:hypothetical protein